MMKEKAGFVKCRPNEILIVSGKWLLVLLGDKLVIFALLLVLVEQKEDAAQDQSWCKEGAALFGRLCKRFRGKREHCNAIVFGIFPKS